MMLAVLLLLGLLLSFLCAHHNPEGVSAAGTAYRFLAGSMLGVGWLAHERARPFILLLFSFGSLVLYITVLLINVSSKTS